MATDGFTVTVEVGGPSQADPGAPPPGVPTVETPTPGSDPDTPLAYTGFGLVSTLVLAVVLLAIGTALLFLGRTVRRRASRPAPANPGPPWSERSPA